MFPKSYILLFCLLLPCPAVIISGQRTKNPKMILFGGDIPEKNLSRSGTGPIDIGAFEYIQ